MKKRSMSLFGVICFLLALLLIVSGLLGGARAFRELEILALSHEEYTVLVSGVRAVAFQLLLSGGTVVLGICILVILLLQSIRVSDGIRRDVELLRKKNENIEHLNKQTRELAHHQRLETIGTLTASIAHEFNNLLTPIMGYSMLALEKLPAEEEELYDNILEIYEASRKAKNIISRLSDLARKNSAEVLRPISIDDLVHKTLDVAAPAKPQNVHIRLDLNCWDQRFIGNEIQVNQLLLNLILNGFHAIGEKEGTLTIHTSFNETSIQIRVEDTGHGIPDEIKNKIFEPFFTTKDPGKGTGLGLAIVAQVVEDHHGSIEVNSTLGSGTEMMIKLPKTAEQSETL